MVTKQRIASNGFRPGHERTEDNDGWIVDLNAIKAKELGALEAAFDQMSSGSIEAIYPWAARIIKQWPFELDPSDPESLGELGMIDFREAIAHLTAAFQRYTEPMDTLPESGNVGSEGSVTGALESAD